MVVKSNYHCHCFYLAITAFNLTILPAIIHITYLSGNSPCYHLLNHYLIDHIFTIMNHTNLLLYIKVDKTKVLNSNYFDLDVSSLTNQEDDEEEQQSVVDYRNYNHNGKQLSQSLSSDSESQDERDGQETPKYKFLSNDNSPQFKQKNKQKLQIQQSSSYYSQSSSSSSSNSINDEDSLDNVNTVNNGNNNSSGRSINKRILPSHRLSALKQQSNEQQQDDQSIDYIEERIRKLERDLQDRLDRHKGSRNKDQSNSGSMLNKKGLSSDNSGRIVSASRNGSGRATKKQPPLPVLPPTAPANKKQAIIKKLAKQVEVDADNGKQPQEPAQLPQTRLNFNNKAKNDQRERRQISTEKGSPKKSSNKKSSSDSHQSSQQIIKQNDSNQMNTLNNHNPNKRVIVSSSANTLINPSLHQRQNKGSNKNSNSSKVVGKVKSNQNMSQGSGQGGKSSGASIGQQLKKMNKEIAELRSENKYLKEQLFHHKRKKKPVEQLVRLKQLSEHDTKKLEKQLELLKVLEKLQTKLKNSIERKLGKGSSENKMSKQAALLHKGLPSNILS